MPTTNETSYQPVIGRFSYTLTPGQSQTIQSAGNWFSIEGCYTSSLIVVSDQNSLGLPVAYGDIVFGPFSSLTITNTDATRTELVTIYIGAGARLYRYPGQDRVTQVTNLPDVSCGAGAQTQILSAGKSQRKVFVALPTGAADVRIGGSSTNSLNGLWMKASGGPMVFDGTVDLYVYNPSGGAINVSLVQER